MTPSLQAAISALDAAFALGVGTTVVDLGAGTGKRSRLLAETGARVIALEPSAALRAELAAAVAKVEIIDGAPDEIPLPEWTADLVFVADAEVWLRTDAAIGEVHRVLKPGGALVAIGDPPPPRQRLDELLTAPEEREFLWLWRKQP